MNNFISIDPSGMGKNGIFDKYEIPTTLQSNQWLNNYDELIFKINYLKENFKDLKVYIEDIKYCFDKVGLETITTIKLIAAIELYCLNHNIKLVKVTSDMVKSRAKWIKDIQYMTLNSKSEYSKRDQAKRDFVNKTEITYYKNKYFYKDKHINAHERDAIIIYHLGKELENETRK